MRSWKAWGLVALAWLSAPAPAPASASAQVDLEPYLRRDGFEAIKISPDGKHYAATVPMEDRTVLVVLRRADKQVVTKAVGVKDSVVADFWWANDERVIVAMAQRLGSRDEPYRTGELHVVGIDGETVKTLVGVQSDPGLVETYGGGDDREFADFIDRVPDDPRKILIGVSDFEANPQTRVERLDIYTGRRAPVTIAPVRRATLLTDPMGQVRLAEGASEDNYSKLYHRDADGDWTLVNDAAVSGHYEWPLGFSADGGIAYLQVGQAQGPDAIVSWNTRTGERKELLRDGDVDPYQLLFDRNRALIGAQYMSAGVHTRFFDENNDTARAYRRLEKAFPDSAVTIASFANDGRIALAQVWNDRMQGDYYLYDTQARTADGVFAQQKWFDPAKMPTSREMTLRARDGVVLHGYLTMPRQPAQQPLPMVVMPHGGPFGVFDKWQFDVDSQLLAEAGYAVLRVNYRGSGNYGYTFRQAGARQWGGTMQDDLTDATQWAIAQNLADSKRICIFGGSYGGYAALMGVAKEPDLYRCAVGYVGVYDLEAMHREDSRVTRWMRNWVNDWVGERDDLAARSPTALAQRIKAPVFLAAGGQDQRAPITHSKKMERALRSTGVPVETLYFSSEGHGFYTESHRREFYARLLEFLSRHIGGARAKDSAEVQATQ